MSKSQKKPFDTKLNKAINPVFLDGDCSNNLSAHLPGAVMMKNAVPGQTDSLVNFLKRSVPRKQ